MVFEPSCKVRMAVWHDSAIGCPASIFYTDNCENPLLAFGPAWFRTENGAGETLRPGELSEYKKVQPFTMGFYEAQAVVAEFLSKYTKCLLGHVTVTLESRNYAWRGQEPAEIGTKIGTLNPRGRDRFQDCPFDVYYLDEDARYDFKNRRTRALEKYYQGIEGIAPDAFLHLTATIDSRRCYVRTIPFTPLNEVSEIKAVVEEQIQFLVDADETWLKSYQYVGQFSLSEREISELCAKMSI